MKKGRAGAPLAQAAWARKSAAASAVVTTDVGRGMAFAIDSSGYLITNRHVVEDADVIESLTFEAHNPPLVFTNVAVEYIDPRRDLALLKVVTDEPLPYLELATNKPGAASGYASVDDPVLLLSRPAEEEVDGLVAQLGNVGDLGVENPNVGPGEFVAVTQDVRQGQSGGPVVDRYGRVVAVVTWTWRDRPGGFAIPIGDAARMLEDRPLLDTHDAHHSRALDRANDFLGGVEQQDGRARRLTSPAHARSVREDVVRKLMERVDPSMFAGFVEILEEVLDTSVTRGEDVAEALAAVVMGTGSEESLRLLGVEGELSSAEVITFFFEFAQAYAAARSFTGADQKGAIDAGLRRLQSLDAARSFALAAQPRLDEGEASIEKLELVPTQYGKRAVATARLADGRRMAIQMRLEWGDWYVEDVQRMDAGVDPTIALRAEAVAKR